MLSIFHDQLRTIALDKQFMELHAHFTPDDVKPYYKEYITNVIDSVNH